MNSYIIYLQIHKLYLFTFGDFTYCQSDKCKIVLQRGKKSYSGFNAFLHLARPFSYPSYPRNRNSNKGA